MKFIITNGKIVDVINGKIVDEDILVEDEKIKKIGKFDYQESKGIEILDAGGYFLVPGLIDAHTHNEMLFVSPKQFSELIISRGTTAAIIDCHDLANVVGLTEAMNYNRNEFKKTKLRSFFTLPCCLPPSKNETNGYALSFEDVLKELDQGDIIGLAEIMDLKGLVEKDELIKTIIEAKKRGLIIDGHCPGITGTELDRYITLSGASSDHEFSDIKEAIEKESKGMSLILRKGIVSGPNSFEIWEKISDKNKLMLSSDGCTTINKILEKGHLDFGILELVKEGIPIIEAIKISTINTARHYNLQNIGSLSEGNFADILFIKNLQEFAIEKVMIGGEFFQMKNEISEPYFPNTINLKIISEDKLKIKSKEDLNEVNTIELIRGSLETKHNKEILKTKEGFLQCDVERDVLYLSIINRYGPSNPCNGFVKNFGMKRGAICASTAQDSQNLIVIGTNHRDMIKALNEVISMGGGFALFEEEKLIASLNLKVAGIMSNETIVSLNLKIKEIEEQLKKRGCLLENPLFDISLCLTVSSIPEIKITDKGLYDFKKASFIGVIC
jgi:adenine deaminase